jgi:hypothetical protein
MDAGEEKQHADGAYKAPSHVPLCVPDVALTTEEGVGGSSSSFRGSEFEQLLERADSHATTEDEVRQQFSRFQPGPSKQYFAGDEGRHKPLREMAETVVVVPIEVEGVLDPLEHRHQSISVVTADHQNGRMHRDQAVDQVGETVARIEMDQKRDTDQHRKYFEEPGEQIVTADQ